MSKKEKEIIEFISKILWQLPNDWNTKVTDFNIDEITWDRHENPFFYREHTDMRFGKYAPINGYCIIIKIDKIKTWEKLYLIYRFTLRSYMKEIISYHYKNNKYSFKYSLIFINEDGNIIDPSPAPRK
jgi:hypothetical protein